MDYNEFAEFDIEKQIGNLLITTKILGRGSTGEVRIGKNCKNLSEIYAVKIIRRLEHSSKGSDKLEEEMLREITILRNISHENIVKIYDVIPSQKYIYMVFEYCNGKSLSQYLAKNNGKLNIEDSLGIFSQICNAFEVLVKKNIMHRDIKPENIMFHNGKIKLVDFGYARFVEKPGPSAYTLLGTPAYMSPQILQKENYSYKCDVWSTGVILFKMLTGEHPFIPSTLNVKELKDFNHFTILELINKTQINWFLFNDIKVPYLQNLVYKMLEIEEVNRYNWKQVIEIMNKCLEYVGKVTLDFSASLSLLTLSSSISGEKMSIEENCASQLTFLINFLTYKRKLAISYEKIAKSFYNLGRNKCLEIEETIGMILFYLLCKMPGLLLEELLKLIEHRSILQFYLLEHNIFASINVEDYMKCAVFEKFKLETQTEMNRFESVSQELEVKITKALQKKTNKVSYIQNFLEHLEKGSFKNSDFVKTTLNETIIHFLEYYKKDINLVTIDCLITFRLLQVVLYHSEIFKWDSLNNKEGIDFDAYYENLKTMKRIDIIKLITESPTV